MTALVGYAWATLAVGDLDTSTAWYRRVFGLDLLLTNADTCAVDTDHFVYLVEPESLFVIGLHQRAASRRRQIEGDEAGLADLAVNVDPRQLRAWIGRLSDLAVPYRGPTPWSTGTVVHLDDPDGNPLLLFEPPGSES